MAKYIPSGNVRNRADLNAELTRIANAINDQLDKQGGSGNQMQADLDMNGNQLLNVPAPMTPTDVLRLGDINQAQVPTVKIPEGVFDITAYGAIADNTTDNKAAIDSAIAALDANGGGTLRIPPAGVFRTSGNHTIPSRMKVLGEGWQSCLKLTYSASDSATQTPVFVRIPPSRPSFPYDDVIFEGVRIEGRADQNGGGEESGNALLTMVGFNRTVIRNCVFRWASNAGVRLNECNEATVHGNSFYYTIRDSCDLWNCPITSVIGNKFIGSDDDSLAINTESTVRPNNVAHSKHIISGNYFQDCGQIRVQSAQELEVTGNLMSRGKGGSFIFLEAGSFSDRSVSNHHSVLISGNIVCDQLDREISSANLTPSENFRTIFKIEAFSATVDDVIEFPYDYYHTNTGDDNSLPRRRTEGIVISNNLVKRTLPAVANYSDWGFGTYWAGADANDPTFAPNGFRDQPITDTLFQVRAFDINGPIRGLYIKNNVIDHSASQIYLVNGNNYTPANMDYQDVVVEGNVFKDFTRGIDLRAFTGTQQDITVANNRFDGDPHFSRSGIRPTTGGFALSSSCEAINCDSVGGTKILGNTFKNVSLPYRVGNAEGTILTRNNTFVGQPEEGVIFDAFSTANLGIGQYPLELAEENSTFIYEDSLPTSSTFGQSLGKSDKSISGDTLPDQGFYFVGQFLPSRTGATSGDFTTLGIRRLLSGTSHVMGTDWETLYVRTSPVVTPDPGTDTWTTDGAPINLSAQTTSCRGIIEINDFMYALSNSSRSVFRYRVTDRQYDNAENVLAGPTFVQDIMLDASDATRWVSTDGNLVRQYNSAWNATGRTLSSPIPQGFGRTSGFFWTIESNGTVRQFNSSTRVATGVTYSVGFTNIQGMCAVNGRLYFVTNTGAVRSVVALDGSDDRLEIDTGLSATGIWTDGTNMWVSTATSAQRYTSS